ncbi:hypothetical protein HN011_005735 [Eciton burchellii]|nr:hypothetical protein HN011_005735 [Eciton burchellii]
MDFGSGRWNTELVDARTKSPENTSFTCLFLAAFPRIMSFRRNMDCSESLALSLIPNFFTVSSWDIVSLPGAISDNGIIWRVAAAQRCHPGTASAALLRLFRISQHWNVKRSCPGRKLQMKNALRITPEIPILKIPELDEEKQSQL